MAAREPAPGKKFFTPQQANAALPLVRAIVRDITNLAHELRERHERLRRIPAARQEERDDAEEEFERAKERLGEFERELAGLGVELKDYFTGLVDFPARMSGRTVYLCWRLGEPEVAHWHELEAGFAGRQKLTVEAGARCGPPTTRDRSP